MNAAWARVIQDLTRVTGWEAEGLADFNVGAASRIRGGLDHISGAESNSRFPDVSQQFEEIYGPRYRSPSQNHRFAEESLSAIYGDLYRTDSSATAGQHAAELLRVPRVYHDIVRETLGNESYHRAGGDTHGGIWFGDGHILDLGHPVINRSYEWASHIEGSAGVFQRIQRALLLGGGEPISHNGPLHEFGHASDFSLGDISRFPNFQGVHDSAIRELDRSRYSLLRMTAEDWRDKPSETFAEGFAWFYGEHGSRPFLGSDAAADHMWKYFLGLDKWVRSRYG
jgi:hypothetical protein